MDLCMNITYKRIGCLVNESSTPLYKPLNNWSLYCGAHAGTIFKMVLVQTHTDRNEMNRRNIVR